MRRWIDKLTHSAFLSSGNDLTLFYPYGPFKGYSVPRPRFQRVLQRAIGRFNILAMRILIISLILGAVLGYAYGAGYAYAAVAASLLAVMVAQSMLIRRLTKRLQPLPFGLGFRFYGRHCDEQWLYQSLAGSLVMLATAIVLFVLKPSVILIVSVVIFLPLLLLAAILVSMRHRLVRRVPR